MAELRIPLHDLDNLGKDFVFALDGAWLDRVLADTGVRGDTSAGPGAVEVHAQRNGREILVHGRARAPAHRVRALLEGPAGRGRL